MKPVNQSIEQELTVYCAAILTTWSEGGFSDTPLDKELLELVKELAPKLTSLAFRRGAA